MRDSVFIRVHYRRGLDPSSRQVDFCHNQPMNRAPYFPLITEPTF